MKQRLLTILLTLLPLMASADDSGPCSDNIAYTFVESTGILTISGEGAMSNYYVNGVNVTMGTGESVTIALYPDPDET